jgi:hypothetical protein
MSASQHKFPAALLAVLGVISLTLAGCAGNGQGLNSNGAPIGSGGSGNEPLTADWQSIQDNVFTPICSPCHQGSGAPHGLILDSAHSYADLVGVPSDEVPSLKRVKPADPDSSYITIKLTNGPGIVGGQMPLDETPLPQSTINVIKQWIANGAPQSGTSTVMTAEAALKLQARGQVTTPAVFRVNFTSPTDAEDVESPLRHILVAFNHEVDASLVNYTNLIVERIGPVGTTTSSTARTLNIPSHAALAEGNPSTVIITPVTPLLPGVYRVTIRAGGGGALADLNSQTLVTDYSFTFTVDGAP